MYSLRDLTLGRYVAGNSILHRLDPRTKLICALLLMIAVFFVNDVASIVVFLVLTIALFPVADLSLRFFWGNVRVFIWLYAITFFIHLFFHPGKALFSVPFLGWSITEEGLSAGALFTIRIAVLVSLSNLLMAVTMPQDLTDGMERLFRPLTRLGIPVGEGALMISIALRFVPVLMQEAEKIQKAQMARGADLEGSWMIRVRKSLPMILPLFAGALKRADDLALALEARAYQGGEGRTRLVELRYALRDFSGLLVVVLFAAGIFLLR